MSTELVFCPLCRVEMHRHVAGKVEMRIKLPSRTTQGASAMTMLGEQARAEHEAEMAACERDCVAHYEQRHSLRLRLWRRLGWAWLMRWPTRDPALGFDQIAIEPLQFVTKQKESQ